MRLTHVLGLVASTTAALAHGDHLLSRDEFNARSVLAEERHLKARNCYSEIAEFTTRRKAKRATLRKRHLTESETSSAPTFTTASYTLSVPPPRESVIHLDNYTCVAAPDVVEGPYYINNEIVRYNLTEGQEGVELILDIGVINIATCEPFPNLFVELWSANATGVYAGFSRTSTPGSTTTTSAPATTTTFARPPMLRNETFLRGGLPTNEEGIVELVTLYPGFYAGRASHIHAMFHHDWAMSPNGTLISQAGTNVHTGQVFFEESWNDEIYATELYMDNDNIRVFNHEDRVLTRLSDADRDNVFVDLERLGDSLDDGLYGYITIAIDPTNSVRINGTHYLNSTGYEPAPPLSSFAL